MFCVKCGKEVADGTKFCTNCGAEIEEVKVEEPKDDKFTYSQNQSIATTSNPTPVVPASANSEGGDGKATASVVLGIVSLVLACGIGFITAIVGLILGICSKKSGKKTAGIILNSIALGLSIIVPIILLNLFGSLIFWSVPTTSTTTTTPSTNNNSTVKKGSVVTGSTFTFDIYEMTLGKTYEIIKVEDTSSSNYGIDVIKLPVTIKNTSTTRNHLNMYYHEFYGPNGEEIDSLRNDFGSRYDAIDYVWLDGGESKLQYFYIKYKGNGKYQIKFDNYKEEKTVEFTIKK